MRNLRQFDWSIIQNICNEWDIFIRDSPTHTTILFYAVQVNGSWESHTEVPGLSEYVSMNPRHTSQPPSLQGWRDVQVDGRLEDTRVWDSISFSNAFDSTYTSSCWSRQTKAWRCWQLRSHLSRALSSTQDHAPLLHNFGLHMPIQRPAITHQARSNTLKVHVQLPQFHVTDCWFAYIHAVSVYTDTNSSRFVCNHASRSSSNCIIHICQLNACHGCIQQDANFLRCRNMYTTSKLHVSEFTFVHIDMIYIRRDTNYVRVYATCPSHLESPLIESRVKYAHPMPFFRCFGKLSPGGWAKSHHWGRFLLFTSFCLMP